MLSDHSYNFSTFCGEAAAFWGDFKSTIQVFLEVNKSKTFLHDATELGCYITQLNPGQPKIQINLNQTSSPAKDLQIKAMRILAWQHNNVDYVGVLSSSTTELCQSGTGHLPSIALI